MYMSRLDTCVTMETNNDVDVLVANPIYIHNTSLAYFVHSRSALLDFCADANRVWLIFLKND